MEGGVACDERRLFRLRSASPTSPSSAAPAPSVPAPTLPGVPAKTEEVAGVGVRKGLAASAATAPEENETTARRWAAARRASAAAAAAAAGQSDAWPRRRSSAKGSPWDSS